MPLDGLDNLNELSMKRIHKSVTRNGFLKGVEETISAVRIFLKNCITTVCEKSQWRSSS